MELNKKSKFAENVKNKILNLQDAIERNNNIEQFIKDYESMKYGLIDTDISFIEFFYACNSSKNYILDRIKTPTTAIFPSCWWRGKDYKVFASGKNTFQFYGHYDAQNLYGAMVRTKYSVFLFQNSKYEFTVWNLEADPPL